MRVRGVLFYPLAVATFPVVYLYAQNPGESITVTDFLFPLAVVLAGTLAAILFLRLFIRDNAKAAVIVSILLAVFFSLGHINQWMLENDISWNGMLLARYIFLLPASTGIALIAVGLAMWYRGDLSHLMRLGAVIFMVLVLYNVGWIIFNATQGEISGYQATPELLTSVTSSPLPGIDDHPDIYYIVLDSYGRADVLNRTQSFDNSGFIDFLTRKGFYVASESRANYTMTPESLASSLNMRYLDELTDNSKSSLGRRKRVTTILRDNAVLRLVKSLGYEYIHFDSGWAVTRRNGFADQEPFRVKSYGNIFSDFSIQLYKSSMAQGIGLIFGYNADVQPAADRAELFKESMRMLGTIPDKPQPTFVFNHNIPPHPPFMFDRAGSLRQDVTYEMKKNIWREIELYVDQLIYVNETIESVVNEILERSPREPVIIIQADHGPNSIKAKQGVVINPTSEQLFERTGILNAYYLPKYCRGGFYPTISPVNTFRVVFDRCLGTDFGPLEDKTYFSDGGPGPARYELLLVED